MLPAHSGGSRVQRALRQTALTMRAEPTSDISRWLKRKLCPATSWRRRTTTSMPNIILGRCPRTAETGRRWRSVWSASTTPAVLTRQFRPPNSAPIAAVKLPCISTTGARDDEDGPSRQSTAAQNSLAPEAQRTSAAAASDAIDRTGLDTLRLYRPRPLRRRNTGALLPVLGLLTLTGLTGRTA